MRHKSGVDLPLTQMPNSSAINLSVSLILHEYLFALSQSFLGFCLLMADPNVAHVGYFLPFEKAFEPFINTFSAHDFPPVHPHQHFTRLRCSFPQFVAELEVCTLFHCAVTLPLTLTMFNWPQSVYTASHMQSMLCHRFSPCV